MLKKGQRILMDHFYYELMSDAMDNKKLKEVLYTAKVKKCYENGKQEERFIKFVTTDQKELLKRLQKESRFLMHYPFIGKVYGSNSGKTEAGDRVFVVEIEYIRGDDLKNAIELKYFKDEEQEAQILLIFYQLLRAANYYSKCEREEDAYLHRDIKPENIMLVEKDGKFYPVLIDFDFAHIRGSKSTDLMLEEEGKGFNLGGTFGYADPRAWGPFRLDIQADIYSMGRTFCFCLLSKEWREFEQNKEGINEYYTHDEYIRIGRKMVKLCQKKAEGLPLPEETDESYFTPEWMKLAYGLDMSRLDSKYHENKYRPLMEILKNMVEAPWARYRDFGIILQDMESFIESLYGREKMEVLGFYDMLLEEKSKKEENPIYFFCNYEQGDGASRKNPFGNSGELNHGEMKDLYLCNVKVATIYNKRGILHYITYGTGVKTNSGKNRGALESEDIFEYKGYRIGISIDTV